MGKKIILILLTGIITGVLSGCGAKTAGHAYLFPPLHKEPRFVYLKSYEGPSTYKKPGFFDNLFGFVERSSMKRPSGVYMQDDVLYVAVTQEQGILVMDDKQQQAVMIGAIGNDRIVQPIGVAATTDGRIFVSDSKLKKVWGYDKATGEVKADIVSKETLTHPTGVAVSNTLKRLYIADSFGHKVHVYSFEGEMLFSFGGRGSDDGYFNFPSNIAVDRRNDDIYVVDTQNFRVQVFDKDGQFVRKFGSIGDIPGTFARPKGVGVDSEGNVYVADSAFDNFQIFNEKGQILMHIGGLGMNPGQFSLPTGLYVDEYDRIFVADSMNERIQSFQYFSEKWRKEHPEEYKQYLFQAAEDVRKAEDDLRVKETQQGKVKDRPAKQ